MLSHFSDNCQTIFTIMKRHYYDDNWCKKFPLPRKKEFKGKEENIRLKMFHDERDHHFIPNLKENSPYFKFY